MRKLTAVVGVLAVAPLVLAGCGKSSNSSGSSGASSKATSPPVTLTGQVNTHGIKDVSSKGSSASLEVEADDFYFGPSFIKAAAGQTLTLELKNDGKVPHTFTTADGTVDEQLAPDGKKTVTVKAPASGVLVWYCRFHRGQGMQGAVFLHEGDSAAAASSSTSSSGGYGY